MDPLTISNLIVSTAGSLLAEIFRQGVSKIAPKENLISRSIDSVVQSFPQCEGLSAALEKWVSAPQFTAILHGIRQGSRKNIDDRLVDSFMIVSGYSVGNDPSAKTRIHQVIIAFFRDSNERLLMSKEAAVITDARNEDRHFETMHELADIRDVVIQVTTPRPSQDETADNKAGEVRTPGMGEQDRISYEDFSTTLRLHSIVIHDGYTIQKLRELIAGRTLAESALQKAISMTLEIDQLWDTMRGGKKGRKKWHEISRRYLKQICHRFLDGKVEHSVAEDYLTALAVVGHTLRQTENLFPDAVVHQVTSMSFQNNLMELQVTSAKLVIELENFLLRTVQRQGEYGTQDMPGPQAASATSETIDLVETLELTLQAGQHVSESYRALRSIDRKYGWQYMTYVLSHALSVTDRPNIRSAILEEINDFLTDAGVDELTFQLPRVALQAKDMGIFLSLTQPPFVARRPFRELCQPDQLNWHDMALYDDKQNLIYLSSLRIHGHVSLSAPERSLGTKDHIVMSDNELLQWVNTAIRKVEDLPDGMSDTDT